MTRLVGVITAMVIATAPAFALDRTAIKDSHGRTIGGIVSKNGRSVIVDSKGHVVAVGANNGKRSVVITLPKEKPRAACSSGSCPFKTTVKKPSR